MLRIKVDWLTMRALSLIKPGFVDMGSKFHKITNMTHMPFIAVRANLFPYDLEYLNKHKKKLLRFCPQVTLDENPLSELSTYRSPYLSIDSMYYPGV